MGRTKKLTAGVSPKRQAEAQLQRAIQAVGKQKKTDLLTYAVKRAYSSDAVLQSILKYILPKEPMIDNSTTHNYAQIKVIIDDRVKGLTEPEVLATSIRIDEEDED